MNKIIIGLSTLLLSIGFTQELQLRDLWYQPKAGVFGGMTGASYGKTKQEGTSVDIKSSNWNIDQTFQYGITNELAVAVEDAYGSDDPEDGGVKSSGITDPNIRATYGQLVNTNYNLFLRGILNISPSLGKNTAKNQYRGSTLFSLTGHVGQKIDQFEYFGGLSLAYFTDAKSELGDNKSVFDWAIVTGAQYDFTDMISADLFATVTFPGDQQSKAGGPKLKSNPAFMIQLGPEFQFVPQFALQVLGFYQHSSLDAPAPASDTKITTFGGQLVAKYNFN